MKRYLLIPALAMALLTGCKDPYAGSAKAAADIATGIAGGMSTVATLASSGQITAAEGINVLGYLEFANKGDEAFLSCVQTAHANGNKAGTYTACATAFNTTLNNPTELALIHVNEGPASATISSIVKAVTDGVTLIITQLGGS